jgi:hypothetical protein
MNNETTEITVSEAIEKIKQRYGVEYLRWSLTHEKTESDVQRANGLLAGLRAALRILGDESVGED